jgi:hypothetical protein
VIRRKLGASLLIVAALALCGGDLLASRFRSCGPHPCCTKGACTMMQKNAPSRLDRCSDEQPKAPDAPMLLTASASLVIGMFTTPSFGAPAACEHEGVSLSIDRPPRV